mgnify:CR=1 FL=1
MILRNFDGIFWIMSLCIFHPLVETRRNSIAGWKLHLGEGKPLNQFISIVDDWLSSSSRNFLSRSRGSGLLLSRWWTSQPRVREVRANRWIRLFKRFALGPRRGGTIRFIKSIVFQSGLLIRESHGPGELSRAYRQHWPLTLTYMPVQNNLTLPARP